MIVYRYFIILLLLHSLSSVCTFHKQVDAETDEEIVAKVSGHEAKQFENYVFDPDSVFSDRVKDPPGFVLMAVSELDNRDYTPYIPTNKELKIIEKAYKSLPALHRKIIKERVIGVYFLNNFLGSGMADWVVDKDKKIYCTLFFNPITLKMNMSEWSSYKEKTCFIRNSKDVDIVIKAGTAFSGFLGILLHESTHVVDYVKNITPFVEPATRALSVVKGQKIENTPYVKGIWKDYRSPEEEYDFPDRKDITFYGMGSGPKIKITDAPNLYKQLSGTSFVSLYGSMSWSEDLAEFLLFYHMTQKLKQPYIIYFIKDNKRVYSYEPMKSRNVTRRFSLMKVFYK